MHKLHFFIVVYLIVHLWESCLSNRLRRRKEQAAAFFSLSRVFPHFLLVLILSTPQSLRNPSIRRNTTLDLQQSITIDWKIHLRSSSYITADREPLELRGKEDRRVYIQQVCFLHFLNSTHNRTHLPLQRHAVRRFCIALTICSSHFMPKSSACSRCSRYCFSLSTRLLVITLSTNSEAQRIPDRGTIIFSAFSTVPSCSQSTAASD